VKLEILDQGQHHVVVNKPAGVLSVRARGGRSPTMVDLVKKQLDQRVLPVHRLDRPTSGCMAFALSEFGQQAISDAFRRHRVDKRYIAVVSGKPARKKLAIDARLLREEGDGRKGPAAWSKIDDAGKRALTRVEVVAGNDELSVVVARPETGRMHQIRAHLAHVGHPLLGDTLYGGDEREGGFLLHALLLSFPAPKGPRVFAAAPLPPSWDDALERTGAREAIEAKLTGFRTRADRAPAHKPAQRPDRRPDRKAERPKRARGRKTR
jgi:23S rRNA pseudouridine955/2504/2580 synthase